MRLRAGHRPRRRSWDCCWEWLRLRAGGPGVRRWVSGSPSPREAGRGSGRGVLATVAVLVIAAAPLVARANGAFPDSENILTPADRPQDILLVTNFGLVSSSDGGQTWLWSCEQDGNM